MASSIIHIAVANEVNKVLKRDSSLILIGSIAPDLSKLVGEPKSKSHFLAGTEDIPIIDRFLQKYRNRMNDDFVMGYYIHLYTDFLWSKYFMPEVYDRNKKMIKKLNGETVKCNGNMLSLYIYNDYTNLNVKLIDNHELDLKIFYNDIPKMENIIEEIPMDKIQMIVAKTGEIVKNSRDKKTMIIDIDSIEQFIKMATKLTLASLEEIK